MYLDEWGGLLYPFCMITSILHLKLATLEKRQFQFLIHFTHNIIKSNITTQSALDHNKASTVPFIPVVIIYSIVWNVKGSQTLSNKCNLKLCTLFYGGYRTVLYHVEFRTNLATVN